MVGTRKAPHPINTDTKSNMYMLTQQCFFYDEQSEYCLWALPLKRISAKLHDEMATSYTTRLYIL